MCKKHYKWLFVLVSMTFFSCKEDVIEPFIAIHDLPQTPYNYSNVIFPEAFNDFVLSLDNTPNDNQITNHGATLGRVLFYDKKLSLNHTISCASCHIQEFGFSDPRQKSIGFKGGHTRRNSMNLVNSSFYEPNKYFWDHRANSLEEQVLMPLQDVIEMGMTLELLIARLSTLDYYKPLFQKAFDSEEVTSDKISKALAQFVRSIYSFNSKYDRGIEATKDIFKDFPNFTAQENMGKDIFNGKLTPTINGNCAFCHMTNINTLHFSVPVNPDTANQVIFSAFRADNIGLDEDLLSDDNGLGEITNNISDNGKFKTPSIRNIELTAPYMHDGRFETLEEVVEHYSTGVKAHPFLSSFMINGDGTPRKLNLTDEESAALVAFLKTLTDEVMINEVKYSNPFIE
ncbi:MAG: cytochrome-c peroxidase [Flavobacteriaceae bacterium]|nr:cytochrome-c peroxidase [Flavobacteriaceae bacterium]